ncbi:MAG: formylglycine-generating enzyme family protein, partial [Anaerolineae bacterium]|nr:formylglycine-generating enzyme family protein [Anaerolineae bacterium]
KLPDMAWCEVPGGAFLMGSDRKKDEQAYDDEPQLHEVTLPTFYIARYLVTYAQFQTFLDDPEGYSNAKIDWFAGLAGDEDDRQIDEQIFKYANHPRENVNWYQAMAFCRWLSWRLGSTYDLDKVEQWAVRLPTEAEWEKAARGTQGLIYPYGDTFDAGKGNTYETGIGRTSTVGIFPDGGTPYKQPAHDMSGNVWEWCLSDYTDPYEHKQAGEVYITTISWRVLRGGSWYDFQDLARAAYRRYYDPDNRLLNFGFRVVCAAPIT